MKYLIKTDLIENVPVGGGKVILTTSDNKITVKDFPIPYGKMRFKTTDPNVKMTAVNSVTNQPYVIQYNTNDFDKYATYNADTQIIEIDFDKYVNVYHGGKFELGRVYPVATNAYYITEVYELPNNLISAENMFSKCSSLTSLDLSNFDTSNVINVSYMFNYCNSLASLNLGNFDTSKVTVMTNMFRSCTSLTTVTGTITGIKVDLDLSDCPLTNNSAMVFINGLAEVDTTKTIKFSTATYNTLTEEQIAMATSKGWTVQ